jgi:hypothetical protein
MATIINSIGKDAIMYKNHSPPVSFGQKNIITQKRKAINPAFLFSVGLSAIFVQIHINIKQ